METLFSLACKILWRLYSPYRKHRELIAEAVYYALKGTRALEKLLRVVTTDYRKEIAGKSVTTKNIPPGYLDQSKQEEKK